MVKIAADSTVDLGRFIQEREIHILPLTVTLEDKAYTDGVDISPEHIYASVQRTGKLPKTAARSVQEFIEFFEKLTADGSEVVLYTISACLSVTNENAVTAAKELKHVHIVDTKSLSTGGGLLTLFGCDLRDTGKYSAKEIAEMSRARADKVQASFFVDTMEFLYKGGRCSGLASFVAGVLKLKPELLLKDGMITVGKKFIGNSLKTCSAYTSHILSTFKTPDLKRAFITHTSAAPEVVEAARRALTAAFPFAEIIETIAGCTVTCHCGKGTLGILYINDGGSIKE